MMLITVNSFSQLTYSKRINKLQYNNIPYDQSRTNNLRLITYQLSEGVMLSEAFFENGKIAMCLTTCRDLKKINELRNIDVYFIRNPEVEISELVMWINGVNINDYFCRVSEITKAKDLYLYTVKYE